MTIIELPHNSINPRIVLGYDNQIKLMVTPTDDEKWTEDDFKQLEECKIEYLQDMLGYTIKRLEDIIKHDDYEKQLEDQTTFFKANTSQ